ncbi:MAG: hypothetical protein IPM25_00970 [Chloracidobacterium sp.]|nr:hypothetical protein [Chloracidobacterium sp.]
MCRSLLFLAVLAVFGLMPVLAQADIRKVDFANFTYPAFCASEESENITVKNREYSYERQEDGYVDRMYMRVYEPVFGDLTGDGRDEAAIVSICNTGGTGQFSEGYVFGMSGGKPKLLARFEGGDRAYGGIREVRVAKGLLSVDRNDPGEIGANCCAELIVTTTYRLAGDKLEAVGKPVTRPIYPVERVSFAKGANSKTIVVTIPMDEGRRYVLRAGADQKINVTVDSQDAGIRLLEEADYDYVDGNIVGTLPKSGDYTVEVRNNSEGPLKVTLTIKIQ